MMQEKRNHPAANRPLAFHERDCPKCGGRLTGPPGRMFIEGRAAASCPTCRIHFTAEYLIDRQGAILMRAGGPNA